MNWWRFAMDWTPLSSTSTLSGYQFNSVVKALFGEKTIEDLWLPYFCLSTDITSSQMKVHRNGEGIPPPSHPSAISTTERGRARQSPVFALG